MKLLFCKEKHSKALGAAMAGYVAARNGFNNLGKWSKLLNQRHRFSNYFGGNVGVCNENAV